MYKEKKTQGLSDRTVIIALHAAKPHLIPSTKYQILPKGTHEEKGKK